MYYSSNPKISSATCHADGVFYLVIWCIAINISRRWRLVFCHQHVVNSRTQLIVKAINLIAQFRYEFLQLIFRVIDSFSSLLQECSCATHHLLVRDAFVASLR
jgi:hypothetical protein